MLRVTFILTLNKFYLFMEISLGIKLLYKLLFTMLELTKMIKICNFYQVLLTLILTNSLNSDSTLLFFPKLTQSGIGKFASSVWWYRTGTHKIYCVVQILWRHPKIPFTPHNSEIETLSHDQAIMKSFLKNTDLAGTTTFPHTYTAAGINIV